MIQAKNVPAPNTSELNTVRRARGGEADAVAELYATHSPAIFRYFYFRVPDRATAEDLTAEVFVKMVEGLPRYEERGVPISAWLFRIAHDRVVDYHRRSALRKTEMLTDSLVSDEASIEVRAVEQADRERIGELMDLLTEEQRTVVQMRFIEGYSLEVCARILKKSTGAIKALQHRALRQLAQRLERP